MIKRILIASFLFAHLLQNTVAQISKSKSSGDILQMLEKLNTIGSVLYIAAHPDDENTQLISYFANGLHLRTGYLSATRGDGGQNLIGTEIKESLGVIRTQELLAARAIDGGEQFFSRAVDFGYSKHPDETFNKWEKEKVLEDFVWVIRKFKPDVIVTRFNTSPGTTHGHHTASAILAKEAFALSNDSSAFPDQLASVDLWEVKKIFWNASTWFYRRTNQEFNPDEFVKLDVGAYNTYLGKSYTEISALSRSMHKSQGFGRVGSRGSEYEYLKQWEGEESVEVFDGIETSWSRIKGGEQVQYHLEQAFLRFDPKEPELIVPDLLMARKEINQIANDHWRKIKLREVEEIILAVTGTFLQFTSEQSEYAPGDSITISFEAINRSNADIKLSGVSFSRWSDNYIYQIDLANNQTTSFNYSLNFSKRTPISQPYWLQESSTEGMYDVRDPEIIGFPENSPLIVGKVSLKIEDQFINYNIPVIYKRSDRVKGEVIAPISITPPIMVNLDKNALIYSSDEPKEVSVVLIAGSSDQAGQVSLDVPNGWKCIPELQDFSIMQKGGEETYTFMLYPPKEAEVSIISAKAIVGDQTFVLGKEIIEYDHFPKQIRFPKAATKVVKLDLKKKGSRVGYIMGAGDKVPSALEQMGYNVSFLGKDKVTSANMKQFDAVIVGIRAFNTLDWLSYRNEELFAYAEKGGTVIVQYNTSGVVTDELAPYPLKISRDRVSVEDAEVRFLVKKHEVLNRPNKITNQDFEDWVQERGLYFPNEWDEKFEAVISASDPGETPKDGSLLIAEHGEGYYIYTGLSFFRELPAGVPGAFRLMANLISIGKNNKTK